MRRSPFLAAARLPATYQREFLWQFLLKVNLGLSFSPSLAKFIYLSTAKPCKTQLRQMWQKTNEGGGNDWINEDGDCNSPARALQIEQAMTVA